MTKPNMPWWAHMGFKSTEPAQDTDYADMGTAFGLDASFGKQLDSEARPACEPAAEPDPRHRRSVR